MIYLFERIPINISEEKSIEKMFSKLNINVQTLGQIEEIEMSKGDFYPFFEQLTKDKNYIPQLSTLRDQKNYLKKANDLLTVGIQANFNMIQTYSPFLTKKKNLRLTGDLASSLIAEYIFSRYCYSLGSIKFLKKKIQLHLKKNLKDDEFDEVECKEIINIYKLGFLRLAKIYKNKTLIWSQLNNDYQNIDSLKIGTLDLIYKINEINLSNLYVYENLMKFKLDGMQSKVRNFLSMICKSTMNKISNVHFLIKNFGFYDELERLKRFLESFMVFYSLILNTLILRENKELENQINLGNMGDKSISQIYFENYILANKIFDLEKKLNDIKKNKKEINILPFIEELIFNNKNNEKPIFLPFIEDFYNKYIRNKDLLKWGIQIYKQMENEIIKHLKQKPSLDDLYGAIDSEDIIAKRIDTFIKED